MTHDADLEATTDEAAPQLSLAQLALIHTLGKIDAKDRAAQYAQVGTALEDLMRAEHARTGARSLDVTLPNGIRVATINMPAPTQPTPRVVDKGAYEAWVEQNAPEGTIEVTTTVKSSYEQVLFTELTVWVDDPTWEPQHSPGCLQVAGAEECDCALEDQKPPRVAIFQRTGEQIPGLALAPENTRPAAPRTTFVKPSKAKSRVRTEGDVDGEEAVRAWLGSGSPLDLLAGHALPEIGSYQG